MKDPNGFDELARRKLAERDFAFDPSHWTDMERLLAERDRKPKAWWPWMAAGVLLLGGGALWAGMEATSSASGPSVSVVGSAAPQAATNGPVRSGTITAPTEAVLSPTTEKQPPEQKRAVEPKTAGTSTTPTKQVSTNVGNSNIPTATPQAHPKVAPKMMPTPMAAAPVAQLSGPSMAITTVITAAPTNSGVASESDATGHPSEAPGTTDLITDRTAAPVEPDVAASQETAIPVQAAPTAEPVETPIAQEPPTALASPATDGMTISSEPATTAVQDAPAIEPPPPPPSTWLAIQTPFELTALGGLFSTSSEYRGSGTENWDATVDRQNTAGFGLEGVWTMGAHFGLGTGAHYGSYRERLHTAELSRTDQVLTNNYFWVPYDTMVLTVIGTDTIGATIFNITELVPTTIYDLGHSTDTTYNTTSLRAARTVTNTVSYLEIPLLLDAHTSCGRWVFGVRGGPSLGLLTSKQGTVPGDGEAGFTDFNERTFRSITLGCSARAYARYRLTSAWSVGVEPTWRQQLGNAFNDGAVQRRSNALGAYLSLSYRFAPKSVVP